MLPLILPWSSCLNVTLCLVASYCGYMSSTLDSSSYSFNAYRILAKLVGLVGSPRFFFFLLLPTVADYGRVRFVMNGTSSGPPRHVGSLFDNGPYESILIICCVMLSAYYRLSRYWCCLPYRLERADCESAAGRLLGVSTGFNTFSLSSLLSRYRFSPYKRSSAPYLIILLCGRLRRLEYTHVALTNDSV